MDVFPIRNRDDHAAALSRINTLWGAAPGTSEGDLLDVLIDLVEHFEDKLHPVASPHPSDLLRSRLETRTLVVSKRPSGRILNEDKVKSMLNLSVTFKRNPESKMLWRGRAGPNRPRPKAA
jgi:antitoxin component HigA of HigAB toxin-antitoxin module